MRLTRLLEGIPHRSGKNLDTVEVTGITTDSRNVHAGDLFVALPGHRTDGHEHVLEAVRAGAGVLLVDRELAASVPTVVVPSTLQALSLLSARFFGHPSRWMDVVGVTGTNGKTTITWMLECLWKTLHRPAGVMGTITHRWPGHREQARNTTPLSVDVHRLLATMRGAGATVAAMEVSSHALAQERVEDVDFSVAVFTNLTQDHLDYHETMENYFKAKAHLFELLNQSPRLNKRAVINRDDPWAERLLSFVQTPVWTYGIKGSADFRADNVVSSSGGSRFHLSSPAGTVSVPLPLVGRHNIYNALATLATGVALGASLDEVVRALDSLPGVPGRLERVTEHPAGDRTPSALPFSVFVDYAHTEDALRNVLDTLRPLTAGKLLVLFGCGGDRDRTKRPRMGEAATALADRVVITSDNPRSEDPEKIAADILTGVSGKAWEVVLDREEALVRVLSLAGPGDVVLLAGKGHETTQIFADRTIPFDDREKARRLLAQRV